MAFLETYWNTGKRILFSTPLYSSLLPLVWLFDVVLSVLVILNVAYTEIDWVAYMQQVEIFLNDTRDYDKLIGQTGPCVYPAGHVYLYSILYFLTDHGKSIFKAQFIFLGLYAVTMALVFSIYRKLKKIPLIPLLVLSFASYRIHSIYLLRLFNDPWAIFFLYACINFSLYNHFSLASIFFSLAVGVKMNILLFAPGYLVVLLKHRGVYYTIGHLAECGIIQVSLGAIFLFRNSEAYFSRAFEFSRQFMFKWTVNWRFLPEDLFLDRRFHVTLLCLHLLVLSFFLFKFVRSRGGFTKFLQPLPPSGTQVVAPEDVLYPMFVSNFIGVAFSRSLHYQFYVWYYHSIPFLLWSNSILEDPIRFLVFGLIEMVWNTYPSTGLSSATLHVCHAVILLALAAQPLGVPAMAKKAVAKPSPAVKAAATNTGSKSKALKKKQQ